ncbi:MAG: MBL fold metallo-hydrolase [Myxococcales bacterium]|nr:MBL fold metallo-hydrolase [Myxococcales bacterium]
MTRSDGTRSAGTRSAKRSRARRWLRRVGYLFGAIVVLLGALAIDARVPAGKAPHGQHLTRISRSKHFREGRFFNALPEVRGSYWTMLKRWVTGVEHGEPEQPPPVRKRARADFASAPPSGLRVSWFGHSTLFVEIDGVRLLLDPVWGKRTSPFTWLGPQRFHQPPIALAKLERVDAVVISHDHYDHLDHPTIIELAKRKGLRFIVPLGVGSHLRYWDIAAERITELDWWQRTKVKGITLVSTPARHFSGRWLTDKDKTLWSGWAMLGPKHRAYYSGDTAMFKRFSEIGRRLGPFDITMIEVGAYDQLWPDVHLGPEQAVQAHRDVRGHVLLPVHWGTFNLALHSWVEPIERTIAAAKRAAVTLVTPRAGESVEPSSPPPIARWWPKGVPWRTAKKYPVRSTGL